MSQILSLLNLAPDNQEATTLAREAGIDVQTLQAKIRRKMPLSGMEVLSILNVLKRYHLAAVA